MRQQLIAGIDPGAMGAVTLLSIRPGCDLPALEELVDVEPIAAAMKIVWLADFVVVESQASSGQQGVASSFSLGKAYGRVLGALAACGCLDPMLVAPSRWKASYGLQGGRKGKAASLELALALIGPNSRITRHDQAEAILIAWWGWRKVLAPRLQGAQI